MNFLEKNSIYSLYRDYSLSTSDQMVLTYLYLPILHSDAYALYQELYSQSFDTLSVFSHEDSLQILGWKENQFLDARGKLEAIGLIESYRKESEGDGLSKVVYLYRLLPPASPKKFFADPLLKSLLSSALGNKRYFSIESLFKTKNDFADISRPFDNVSLRFRDVFNPVIEDVSILEESDVDNDKNYKRQGSFNSEKLLKQFAKANVSSEAIKEYLDEIGKTAILYGIDEKQCFELLMNSLDPYDLNTFYLEKFKEEIRNFHKFSTARKSNSKDVLGKGDNAKILRYLTSLTPQNFLAMKLNANPNKFMLDKIEELSNNFNYDNGIINVILDYSLHKTNNEFNGTFIDKVAFSLSANGVSSPAEAMTMLSSRDYEKKRAMKAKKTVGKKAKSDDSEVTSEDVKSLLEDIDL